MTKRTKFAAAAVIISIVISVILFAIVKNGRPQTSAIGGEGLLLLLPLLTYIACKNVELSFKVFYTPKEVDDLDEYESRIVSEPRKLNEEQPRMTVSWSTSTHAEDYRNN